MAAVLRLTLGTAAGAAGLLYAFIATRRSVRHAAPLAALRPRAGRHQRALLVPALARRPEFDSAVIGTSTSRLLRPAALNPAFGARFVNLAMNAATAYEQTRILRPVRPRASGCAGGDPSAWTSPGAASATVQKYTPRPFPNGCTSDDPWRGYRRDVQPLRADGSRQAVRPYHRPEAVALRARRLHELRARRPRSTTGRGSPRICGKTRRTLGSAEIAGSPETWRFATLDLLRRRSPGCPPARARCSYFAPYNHVCNGRTVRSRGSDGMQAPGRAIAAAAPDTVVADFMIPSPITLDDDNYWDALHYRVGDRRPPGTRPRRRFTGRGIGVRRLQAASALDPQRRPLSAAASSSAGRAAAAQAIRSAGR